MKGEGSHDVWVRGRVQKTGKKEDDHQRCKLCKSPLLCGERVFLKKNGPGMYVYKCNPECPNSEV